MMGEMQVDGVTFCELVATQVRRVTCQPCDPANIARALDDAIAHRNATIHVASCPADAEWRDGEVVFWIPLGAFRVEKQGEWQGGTT